MKQSNRTAILNIIQNEIPYLRERFGVERVALFGSFALDEASVDSDVDLVVSLTRPLGFEFIQLADYLESRVGRKIDLVTAASLELEIRDPRRAHIVRNIKESMIYV